MRVNYNIQAIITNSVLSRNESKLQTSSERLSSGFKINAAKDNPSGLAIAKRMNAQLRGISVASQNAADGISVVQTAEGAMSEMQDMIKRMSELAVKAANGTMTDEDRGHIQEEINELKMELQRISDTTDFNGQKLLNGDFDLKGYTSDPNVKVNTFTEEVNPGTYVVSITKTGDEVTAATVLSSDAAEGESFVQGHDVKINGRKVTFYDATGKEVNLDVDIEKFPAGTSQVTLDLTDIGPMRFQVGANEGQVVGICIPAVSLKNLSLEDADVSTVEGARNLIEMSGVADAFISTVRSRLGAYQNRLEHVSTNLETTNENLTGSYSRIMDVDMASEMTEYTTLQVLTQAGTSMLAQANERPQQILQLLQ